MNHHTKRELIISIDMSVSFGSFSIWENDRELINLIGNSQTQRSEDILQILSDLFLTIDRTIADVDGIIYTNGPGSFTGLRVGAATAKGLARAIDCDLNSISVLEAYSTLYKGEESFLVAVLLPNRTVAIQTYSEFGIETKQDEIRFVSKVDFILEIKASKSWVIVDKTLSKSIVDGLSKSEVAKLIIASDSVARYAFQYYLEHADVIKTRKQIHLYG